VLELFDDFRPDRTVAEPIHEQVSNYLSVLIVSGALPTGTQLPAEPVLAQQLSVSRGTLRRAVATLIDRGVLAHHHGRGTFVSDTGPDIESPFVSEITSLAQSLTVRGVRTSTEVLVLERRPADARTAVQLDLAAGDEVIHLDRVRSDQTGPVMRLVNVMRPDVVALHDPAQLAGRGLYDLFEAMGVPADRARRSIGAVVADDELSRILDVLVGHPLLHVEQRSLLADGRPLEFSDVWIRGERLRLEVEVSRDR
jgi:GntR family transcriptional regulator